MNKQLKKSNTRKQINQKKLKTRTKVIVRRLPPNLPEDIFYDSISEWLDNITWKSYFPGKLSKSKAKENVFSRAYLNFKNIETLVEFFKEFDGHLYIDSKGNEYNALVEFSLYQMIPKKRKNVDSKQNTIEKGNNRII
ncbi:RNA-binding domain-containing protein [Anaeromyces robustus]|uniref:RNA-binding domain-containing protein n=1 Tax=Anaeromyces robustus TaxID=1754192 RepID=A0A1Y1WX07_9FUNG|nr:RNA-binding domain-containing protein [Anaeromyces robustus]|eukprot:ORX78089.1 RNA-binding domain-containing protein [Anaeromyces robustus]